MATITEHRLHQRTSAQRGENVAAAFPAEVTSAFGPRRQALIVTLLGAYRVSRREAAHLYSEAFGVTVSTGSISNIEERLSGALAASFEQALAALRASGLAHIDETPWENQGSCTGCGRAWATTSRCTASIVAATAVRSSA